MAQRIPSYTHYPTTSHHLTAETFPTIQKKEHAGYSTPRAPSLFGLYIIQLNPQ